MVKSDKKLLFLLTSFLIFVFGFVGPKEANAAIDGSVTGWAWSENIGWISFNSTNCDGNQDGLTDRINYSQCPVGQPIANYGINIALDGSITGYAWSENIGWINFNPSGPYPACSAATCPAGSPNYSARLESTNKITGWVQACAGTVNGDCNSADRTDGWDGWILMGPLVKNSFDDGAEVNDIADPKEVIKWAWGNNILGWISLNGKNCDANDDGVSDGAIAGCPAPGTPIPPYKVIVITPKPSAEDLSVGGDNSSDYCPSPVHPPVRLAWTFLGYKSGDTQSAYQIQIAQDSGFSSIIEDKGKISNTGGFYVATNLDYGRTYYWRLKVWDNNKRESDWITGPSFSTIAYPYPTPDFIWDPQKITIGEPADFIDLTDFYGAPSPYSWQWDFDNDGSIEYTSQNVDDYIYTTIIPGGRTVRLEVSALGHTCSITKNFIPVLFAPPTWMETKPPSH